MQSAARRKRFTSLRYAASWSGLLSSLLTELKELARERAGEPEPSEVMELKRERETIPTDGVGCRVNNWLDVQCA